MNAQNSDYRKDTNLMCYQSFITGLYRPNTACGRWSSNPQQNVNPYLTGVGIEILMHGL